MTPSHQLEAESGQDFPLTVLLVEDSEVDRQVYRRYLQTDATVKYRFLEAEILEEGLVLYQQEQPDVTLLDFSLPDGDGLEFLTQINDGIADLQWPVVMLTGQGDERIAVKAIKLGAADYLVKQDLTATALQVAVIQTHQNSLLRQQLERSRQQEVIATAIALKIRQSLDLQTILDGAVQEVQKNLGADRVLIYRLTPETDIISGEILAEAVVAPWMASLHQQVRDECLQASAIEKYHQGHAFVANDVVASDLTDCHKQLLARFQVKANLAIPILFLDQTAQTDYLWGLLIAHQCGSPRQWHPSEIRFLQRLSVQLAIAIQQAEFYQSLERLNQELAEANLELRQMNPQLKNEFLANMSHELRTPLTAILGLSELMLDGIYDSLNADQTKATNIIARSAQHLLGLINEILDLAKIESGKMILKPEPCYVVTLCEDCLQFVRSQANKKGLSLKLDVPPAVGQVELDSLRLRQALINLLSNAVKFTPDGGSVMLQVEQEGTWLNFHVIDTGIGIDSGDRHKIFQPFTQLDSQLNRQYEGTGLGLALVKRIAELHQGTISFTSVPHQGSHFTLAIPYKPITGRTTVTTELKISPKLAWD